MAAEYEWLPVDDRSGRPQPIEPTEGWWPLAPGSISACLVVRHEAAIIKRCLDSLTGVVDEILVVHDGPCEDETLAIAARAGCRIFVVEHYGHCEHHLPFAYAQARGEWLLTIDADEFLSPSLRDVLRVLAVASDVNGYEFRWPLWNGRRYVTEFGPYKLALARRSALRMVGIIHSKGEVDGTVRRVPMRLEHQPSHNNFTLGTILKKWRPRAQLQAREYLTDLNVMPRFNYPGTLRWTSRRTRANRWARVMTGPAAIHTFFFVIRQLSGEMSLVPRVRFAFTQALYRGMVSAAVARQSSHRVVDSR